MTFLWVNPRYRDFLAQLGLDRVRDFLQLPGVIYCGHPDRNVSHVRLGRGPGSIGAFLKKEHRVPWGDRLKNGWAGFGLVPMSRREMSLLTEIRDSGIGAPEVLAAGESMGQAFLLTREVDGIDLRRFLHDTADRSLRRELARALGAALARMHEAGLDHPDLYSKHVLVNGKGRRVRVCFLDWQRSRRRRVSWRVRCRDLAALDTSLADGLACARDRLRCLHSYLKSCRQGRATPQLSRLTRRIRRRARRLAGKRHIRELRQVPLPAGKQNLIWLDGEALCVTREFQEEAGRIPGWLPIPSKPSRLSNHVHRQTVTLPKRRRACLVRRHAGSLLGWLWCKLRGKVFNSPELEQAGTLFRLQRYGVQAPRLLAVGQKHRKPWRIESFLLTEPVLHAVGLEEWLAGDYCPLDEVRHRHRVLRLAGDVLRRIHTAGYALSHVTDLGRIWGLVETPEGTEVCLRCIDGLRRRSHLRGRCLRTDLRSMWAAFSEHCSRTDALRFLLAYLDQPGWTGKSKAWARRILKGVRSKRQKPARIASSQSPRASAPDEAQVDAL
jgi:tRNA A-37 threonylcarbamoyl transferase component Bud32